MFEVRPGLSNLERRTSNLERLALYSAGGAVSAA